MKTAYINRTKKTIKGKFWMDRLKLPFDIKPGECVCPEIVIASHDRVSLMRTKSTIVVAIGDYQKLTRI